MLLLATGVVTIAASRPLLSERTENARPFARTESRAARLFAIHRLALRDSIANLALAQLGAPYVLGGATPAGFDCSGLVRYVYAMTDWTPPRTAQRQAFAGNAVSRSALQPGDVLTFGDGPDVTHVGIYVGDGWYVHASSIAGRVILSRVDRRPAKMIRPILGARRLLAVGIRDAAEQLAPRIDANAGPWKIQGAQRVDQRERASGRIAAHDPRSALHRRPQLRPDHLRSG